ncbi:MAG: Uncharacterised protein [SAR116 cluster bacterium]|jgi:tetratricopeptide (TPR) repeat protein|nr:MAG: Uncharacterised protein [SAR116 cluster bacterium]
MKKKLVLFSILCSLLWSLPSYGQNQRSEDSELEGKYLSFFNAATDAYNKGDYKLATDYYENILKGGYESEAIYYNLGNAYYKQNNIAKSIYFFEKALLRAPNDSDILKNLAFAKKMTIDAIPIKTPNGLGQAYGSFVKQYTLNFWSYLAIISMLVAVLSYLSFYFSNRTGLKRASFTIALVSLLVSFFSHANGLIIQDLESKNRPAIIFETSKALSEPNQQGVLIFELHEGTKVQVLERLNEWCQIELSDGQKAWVLQKQLREIKD